MEQNFKIAVPDGCAAKVEQQEGFIIVSFELKKWEPKDGDIVASNKREVVAIYAQTDEDNGGIVTYAGLSGRHLTIRTDMGWGYTEEFRPATEEEKRLLFDALAREGKRWNAEEKRVEDLPRWRALYNENYYVIGSELKVDCQNEIGHVVDDNRYNTGNYFKTREAAEKVAAQIREIFKESKAE